MYVETELRQVGFFLVGDLLDCTPSGTLELELLLPQAHGEGLLKHGLMDLTPRVSESADLGRGLRFCISNKVPGDTDDAGWRTPLEEPPL